MVNKDIVCMAHEAGFFGPAGAKLDRYNGTVEDLERFASLVAAAEREAIQDEFWMSLQSDLENGVKSLNDKAAVKFQNKYPGLVEFSKWLNARGEE